MRKPTLMVCGVECLRGLFCFILFTNSYGGLWRQGRFYALFYSLDHEINLTRAPLQTNH